MQAHKDAAVRSRLAAMGFDVPAVTDPEFTEGTRAAQQRWARIVQAAAGGTPEQFGQLIAADSERWARVVKAYRA